MRTDPPAPDDPAPLRICTSPPTEPEPDINDSSPPTPNTLPLPLPLSLPLPIDVESPARTDTPDPRRDPPVPAITPTSPDDSRLSPLPKYTDPEDPCKPEPLDTTIEPLLTPDCTDDVDPKKALDDPRIDTDPPVPSSDTDDREPLLIPVTPRPADTVTEPPSDDPDPPVNDTEPAEPLDVKLEPAEREIEPEIPRVESPVDIISDPDSPESEDND